MSVLELAETVMKRVRVFCTIRQDLEDWIQKEVDNGRFRNRSHAIEYALLELMKKDKQNS
jgi:Arc/MetJ-type ribon-helix-helix transcriptional regulator